MACYRPWGILMPDRKKRSAGGWKCLFPKDISVSAQL